MSSPTTEASRARPGKVSPLDLRQMKQRGEKIAMVTAYDASSGRLADRAAVDCVLVGDSAAMTVLGRESTVTVTVDEMLMLTRAVTTGVRRALVVADLPFGSYQVSDAAAVEHAIRFIKDARADAVKLEGAGTSISRAAAIASAGIAVVGHLGLTPQSATLLGGYKVQGKTAEQARQLRADAVALEQAGCVALVLEAVPEVVARRITATIGIPTIGIGAGAACDGQVLVWHDLLGLTEGHVAKLAKAYAHIGDTIVEALTDYVNDVRTSRFPEQRHTYPMSDRELEQFLSEDPVP